MHIPLAIANTTSSRLSRRGFLQQTAKAAAATAILGASSSCGVVSSSGRGSGRKVIMRSIGGEDDDAMREAIWKPFTKETGIEVVPLEANVTRIQTMIKSGNIELDIPMLPELNAVTLLRKGALEKLDLGRFSRTKINDDVDTSGHYVNYFVYSHPIVYNKDAFGGATPGDWADFWDVEKFPGKRTMYDPAASPPNLEFALLADGVAVEDLYPIDVDRAFRSFSKLKPHILKWSDSGPLMIQMLAEKQVVMATMGNSLTQDAIEQGLPIGIEWKQAKSYNEVLAIMKDAPNRENAYAYLDYALQPEVQARFCRLSGYGPAKQEAFKHLSSKEASVMPSHPQHLAVSFPEDVQWWADNLDTVLERWQEWL